MVFSYFKQIAFKEPIFKYVSILNDTRLSAETQQVFNLEMWNEGS